MAWGTMSKCEGGGGGKDAAGPPGSVVLERPLRLWSLLIDSVRCGRGLPRPSSPKKHHQQSGSEKLSELLKQAEWWENDQEEVRKKEEALQRLKNVAGKLRQDEVSIALDGAAEVRRLTMDDSDARTTLALLGVIPPLLALLDTADPTFHSQIAALYALLNLAIANDANKAAIVKAGAVHKMLKLIQSQNEPICEAVVANFLGLSALDSNKPIIGSSGAIPFLVQTLKDENVNVNGIAKHDSLRALYNLSISPSNVPAIVETDLIPHLFTKLGDDTDTSERILSIFGNIVSAAEGRKRISGVADAFPILIDIFNWTDSPGCQEKACYVLMVMAHKSYADRQAMIEAGIVSSCLELTLLGSLLAQKRASRMLECVRMEKGKHTVVSAPLTSSSLCSDRTSNNNNQPNEESFLDDDEMMSQETKAVKQLVQQSLHNNMKRMVRRANLPHDFAPSDHFKSFTSTSTSKSLPF